ncbi:hypothetical protein JVT61DRAFT_1683 [Boletus reticuloceps]|uniref:Uncharacterized protein n=1 Tax=Boletus reticuloceps TaxID=495285 RepID=A0A8I2YRS2_9AGAM|nr:hypothetical protein JVT61DRAFT_1683 [Boletus reticuloceps]
MELKSDSFLFVITDKECTRSVEKSTTMLALVNMDLYMQFTFNIDVANVPGCIQVLANSTGKFLRQIGRAPVEQDEALTPTSNCLIRNTDLSQINCTYLLDYNIILCQNVHNRIICGYGIPLASLLLHCWEPDRRQGFSEMSNRVPHQIQFCKKHTKGQPYTPEQKHFVQQILAWYPNITITIAEM